MSEKLQKVVQKRFGIVTSIVPFMNEKGNEIDIEVRVGFNGVTLQMSSPDSAWDATITLNEFEALLACMQETQRRLDDDDVSLESRWQIVAPGSGHPPL